MFFELNCKYYLYVFYKKNLNPYSKLKITKELSFKLQNLIAVCQQNHYYAQKLKNKPIIKKLSPKAMF